MSLLGHGRIRNRKRRSNFSEVVPNPLVTNILTRIYVQTRALAIRWHYEIDFVEIESWDFDTTKANDIFSFAFLRLVFVFKKNYQTDM